jgi:hypothetical protein
MPRKFPPLAAKSNYVIGLDRSLLERATAPRHLRGPTNGGTPLSATHFWQKARRATTVSRTSEAACSPAKHQPGSGYHPANARAAKLSKAGEECFMFGAKASRPRVTGRHNALAAARILSLRAAFKPLVCPQSFPSQRSVRANPWLRDVMISVGNRSRPALRRFRSSSAAPILRGRNDRTAGGRVAQGWQTYQAAQSGTLCLHLGWPPKILA